jgi:hypothetical protein
MSEKMGRATILCRQKSKIAAFTASRTPPWSVCSKCEVSLHWHCDMAYHEA